MSGQDEAHDHGLLHDLERMRALARENIGRRRTLRLLFSASGAALIGACGGSIMFRNYSTISRPAFI